MTATTEAAQLGERARRVIPGGSTHVARSYRPAIYVTRAVGSRKWLVDGREIVDYTMGHGGLLLGHAHPAVVAAVQEQVARGTHYGAGSPLEVEWAELIVDMVASVDEVRFTSSGTEATLLALRVARAATGRDVIVKFDQHFHGWHDAVSVNLNGNGRPAASSPGIPAAFTALTRVARPNDLDGLASALADRQVAAVILEASGAHYGKHPLEPGFVSAARRLCDDNGTLLIIDEVITGFRVARGGMQQALSVTPDLSTFAKVVAGGLPGGAVGGRRDLMELLTVTDGEAASVAERDDNAHIAHPGTFNGNPLTAAAGIATLTVIKGTDAIERATAYGERLETVLNEALRETGVPGRVWRLASMVHLRCEDPAIQAALPGAVRQRGVDLFHASAFCSAVHTDADLEQTAAAVRGALQALR